MDTTVLAYIPSPSQGVWHLGPIPLRAYALCIIVGIIVSVWWGDRRWRARGGQPGDVLDVALWAVPFGLVGGRLYHVATDWQKYFGDGGKGVGGALQIWDGGLGIWGAIALGAVGAWIGCRWKGIKLPPFADALAPAILLAQAIGRLGNYFNQELYGEPTTLPWGLEIYQRVDSSGHVDHRLVDGVSTGEIYQVVHPTFLYELIWNVLIVIALVVIDRYFKVGHGRLFALYVAGYCAGRFGIELMRTDPATHVLGLRINVLTSAIVFLLAALYFVLAPRGRETGLSMFRPDRAEELADLGEVGYLPPELDDRGDLDDGGPQPARVDAPAPTEDGADTEASDTEASDAEASDAEASDAEASDAEASDAEAGDAGDDSEEGVSEADESETDDSEADETGDSKGDEGGEAETDSDETDSDETDSDETDSDENDADGESAEGTLEIRYGGATLKQDPRSQGSTIEIREGTAAETAMVILDPAAEFDEDLDDELPDADTDANGTDADDTDADDTDADDTDADDTDTDNDDDADADTADTTDADGEGSRADETSGK